MTIKDLLNSKFPNENAICVLTRVDFDYLEKTEASLAWKISYDNVKNYNRLIIVNLGGNKNVRGEFIIADIDEIYTVREIKKRYIENNLTTKLEKLINNEKKLSNPENAVFSERNLKLNLEIDSRLVITFNSKTIKKGYLDEDFKGLSNPAFYIHKQNINRTFTSDNTDLKEQGKSKKKELLKLSKLQISNFINFNDLEINFSPNLNVIIGKNNTGKTSLIKLLYSTIKALDEFEKGKQTYKDNYKELLNKKIREVFQSEYGIKTIVNNSQDKQLSAKLTFAQGATIDYLTFDVGKSSEKEVTNFDFSDKIYIEKKSDKFLDFNAVFIPSKELFSIFKIIRESFENRNFGFGATYNDTVKSIVKSFKQTGIKDDFQNLTKVIEENILEGIIEQDLLKDQFYFVDKQGKRYEMTMTAEGINQLGIIPTLIKTGELRKGTILFLDEPDNNLNPIAISEFVNVLTLLSKAGVQIFLTTHSYFIIKRLNIAARKNKDLLFNAFSFIDNRNYEKISIEAKDLKFGLPNYNPIVDEAVRMFNDDLILDINS